MKVIKFISAFFMVCCVTFNLSAQGNDKLVELGFEAFEKENYIEAIDFFSKVLFPLGIESDIG